MTPPAFDGMAASSPLTSPVPAVRPDTTPLPAGHPLSQGLTVDSPLLNQYRGGRDARGNPTKPARRPVWFMRQAGRSLPEYRQLREGTTMLDACLTPEMAAEITMQPVRRHDVDAAIFFSDIVVPLRLAGIDVDILPGVGPVLSSPVRTAEEVAALPELDDSAFEPVREAVALTVQKLAEHGDGTVPLIGFAGAPFTLAAYMVEGRPSRDHLGPRTMMHDEPETWDALASWASDVSGRFMRAQVEAGASAAQLFDSWAGSLGRKDYASFVQKHSAAAFSHLSGLVAGGPGGEEVRPPVVHFGTGTGEILDLMREAADVGGPAAVVGVDYRITLAEAGRRVGPETALQGNIDPALLSAPWEVLQAHVREVIDAGADAPGHVLNLGHGVPPETDPVVLTRLVELIHGA